MGSNISDTKNFQPTVGSGYAGDVLSVEAWEMLKNDPDAVLIDVRTVPEWMFVGVVDLTSLNKDPVYVSWREYPKMEVNENFVEQILSVKKINKDSNIFFLCKIGGRSADAAIEMTNHGFTNCYNIAGGFEGDLNQDRQRGKENGWKSYNLPWEQR